MLYPTLSQPILMIVCFGIGFLGGGFFVFASALLKTFCKKRFGNFCRHFFNFFYTCGLFFALTMANLYINFGQGRVFVIAIFALGIFISQKIASKLVAKVGKKWYAKHNKNAEQKNV